MFVFGASYATTGFHVRMEQPNAADGNPFGNPEGFGYTSCAGPNWVHYLAAQYNESLVDVYDFAWSGAVIDRSIYAPEERFRNDFVTQANSTFADNYGEMKDAIWSSASTLFAIFFAINDVDESYKYYDNNEAIFRTFSSLIDRLHDFGARNFLLLNAPPIDRSPQMRNRDISAKRYLETNIVDFNHRMTLEASSIESRLPGTKVFSFDVHGFLNVIIDSPDAFSQTARLKNTRDYCREYGDRHWLPNEPWPRKDQGETDGDWHGYHDEACPHELREYFWLNGLHPTWPVHQALAAGLAQLLLSDEGTPGK
ncbi:MAG: hypothetical protein Q9218_006139 [Villophora microphyllina]